GKCASGPWTPRARWPDSVTGSTRATSRTPSAGPDNPFPASSGMHCPAPRFGAWSSSAHVNAQFTPRRLSMRRTLLYGLMTALLAVGATSAPQAQGGTQTLTAYLTGGGETPAVNTGA